MIIKDKNFDTKNNSYIMGILNFTPDSFSDGGKFNSIDKALYHIDTMIKDGADIIDIGGESTRPNHIKISIDEEIDRILPLLESVRKNFDIPISLDSYKSAVIKCAVPYIDIVNDIYGLKHNSETASIVAENNLSCCIMHNRNDTNYNSFWKDVTKDMYDSIEIAKSAGISNDRIMIDGGVGFAKSYQQNLLTIKGTRKLTSFGYPILIATSRKSVIGLTLNNDVNDRLNGTIATTVYGALNGGSFFRVHDVKANKDALLMTKAILESKS